MHTETYDLITVTIMCQPSTKKFEILVEWFIIHPCHYLVQIITINFVVCGETGKINEAYPSKRFHFSLPSVTVHWCESLFDLLLLLGVEENWTSWKLQFILSVILVCNFARNDCRNTQTYSTLYQQSLKSHRSVQGTDHGAIFKVFKEN